MRIMRSIALLSLLAAPMAFADTINVSSTGAGAVQILIDDADVGNAVT